MFIPSFNKFYSRNILFIVVGLCLSIVAGFLAISLPIIYILLASYFIAGLLIIILKKPFIGLCLMVSSLPLYVFTDLPGGFEFTSITSLIGGITLLATFIENKNNLVRREAKNIEIIVLSCILFIFIVFGEIFKPISTGMRFPFTYFQLIILVWITYRLLNDRKKIEILMVMFILANCFAVLISLQNIEVYISGEYSAERLSGLAGNANEFAIYLSTAIVMLIYFYSTQEKPMIKVLIGILAAIMLIPVILSGSRGGILFISPVVLLQLFRINKGAIPIIIIFVVITIISINLLPSEQIQRVKDIPADILNQSDTIGLRYGLWEYALSLWKEHPIIGIGTGMFVYESLNSPLLHGAKMLQAHSMYITYLAENGVIGLSIFLLICMFSFLYFERVLSLNPKNLKTNFLAITWECILLIYLLNGIKGNLNTNKMLWICFGVSIAITNFRHTLHYAESD